MEEKELFEKNFQIERKKSKFAVLFSNRKFLITIASFTLFVVLEFSTDFIEIVMGNVIELTNAFRPKSGTLWELNKKDKLADDQLRQISRNLDHQQDEIPDIQNLSQLRCNCAGNLCGDISGQSLQALFDVQLQFIIFTSKSLLGIKRIQFAKEAIERHKGSLQPVG